MQKCSLLSGIAPHKNVVFANSIFLHFFFSCFNHCVFLLRNDAKKYNTSPQSFVPCSESRAHLEFAFLAVKKKIASNLIFG